MGNSPQKTVRLALLAAGVTLVITAVALGEETQVLPHATHLGEGLECAGCHKLAEDGKTFGLPAEGLFDEVCADCHDAEAEETQAVRAVLGRKHQRALPVTFSHQPHEKRTCGECHGDLTVEEARPTFIQRARCEECHVKEKKVVSCKACHGKSRFLPSNHKHGWKRAHGRRTPSVTAKHGTACDWCHTDAGCRACHQQEKPRSHTNFWRVRGHGLRASADRESCATCHVEMTCVRCHRETPPLNHRGPWRVRHGKTAAGYGAGDIGSCSVCHQLSTCKSCHDGL